jgi:hypothetical protein
VDCRPKVCTYYRRECSDNSSVKHTVHYHVSDDPFGKVRRHCHSQLQGQFFPILITVTAGQVDSPPPSRTGRRLGLLLSLIFLFTSASNSAVGFDNSRLASVASEIWPMKHETLIFVRSGDATCTGNVILLRKNVL